MATRASRRRVGIVCLTTALAAVGCTRPPTSQSTAPHGIVLISIDTLRADHLGCYGSRRDTSPFLDSLAARGVLFEQAVSAAPWTLPAHATMLTGVLPSTHRAVEANEAIAPSVRTLAERLQDAGYRTGGFVASWFVSGRYGFNRGFDRFADFGATADRNDDKLVRATQIVDLAESWLRETADKPFFLFVHFYDPHFNYDPPEKFWKPFDTGYRGPRAVYQQYAYYFNHPLAPDLLAHEVSLYDGEIRYVDEEIRRLFGVLERLGAADRTVAFVTSDHGEEFFERGSWGHAHTLYDEVIRVPLIAVGARVAGPRRIAAQVGHVDLVPTILDAVGVRPPEGLAGRSIWPLLTTPEGTRRGEQAPRAAFSDTSRFDTNLVSVRDAGWKLIVDLKGGAESLFDLSSDPGEVRSLASEHPERLQKLHDELVSGEASAVPDRWRLRWSGLEKTGLVGRASTSGRFILARVLSAAGRSRVLPDRRVVEFRLEPGDVLETTVMPVDASVRLEDLRTADGGRAALVTGRRARPAPALPLDASSLDADRFVGAPSSTVPAAAFWLERVGSGTSTVPLSEDEVERLRSLGYVM